MDIKQDLSGGDEIDKLRLETIDLKKDLERERLLHNMLYKEWKDLQEQTSARENEVVENNKASTGFYKYAFYVLLIIMIPIVYFLYPPTGFQKNHGGVNLVSDSALLKDTALTLGAVASSDTVANTGAVTSNGRKETTAITPVENKKANAENPVDEKTKNNGVVVQKATVISPPPVIKPAEKKIKPADSRKQTIKDIIPKPVVIAAPITDDIRDSIAAEGFSGYLYHLPNPYPKSSPRYKIWVAGWNSGRDEARKVVAKDPSLKNK